MRSDAVRNRRVIVAAAHDLLVDRGGELRMDEIARASGVAVGTLYRHFPTKTDLVDSVVAASLAGIADRAELAAAAVANGASAWAELEALLTTFADGASARLAVVQTAALLGFAVAGSPEQPRVPPEARADAQRAGRAIESLLHAAQAAGQMRPDVEVADLFLLLAQAPERRFGTQRARYLEIVSDGLRPRA